MATQPIHIETRSRTPITANPQRDATVAKVLAGINERYEHTLRRLGR